MFSIGHRCLNNAARRSRAKEMTFPEFEWTTADATQLQSTGLAVGFCTAPLSTRHQARMEGEGRLYLQDASTRFRHISTDHYKSRREAQTTCVDRYARWPEAFPVEDITAETVAHALLAGWIVRFGAPHLVTTDQGRQFESALFEQLSLLIGTKHLHTTAYHPAANGMVERFHRQLKSAIVCHADSWASALPVVLLGIRAAWKDDIKATPAEMLYGEPIHLPGELLIERRTANDNEEAYVAKLREHFRGLHPTPVTRHGNKKAVHLQGPHHNDARVREARRPQRRPATGPYEVVERHPKHFNIRVKDWVVPVSLDRLKPAYLLQDDRQDATSKPPPRKVDKDTAESRTNEQVKRTTKSGRRVHFPDRYVAG
ncbi:uncharacterized protein LOC143152324 [Ptiloglossa arizonensis]|uniref:uncharacterized protein LOC143152324 n=1 Tax=Ptiloglossa arizonensis TaxID=3350558 RepID=UPI003FA07434